MTEPVYVSQAHIEIIDGVHRRARLDAGVTLELGVHGPIKEHYRLESEDLPLPVDYVVAAAGG